MEFKGTGIIPFNSTTTWLFICCSCLSLPRPKLITTFNCSFLLPGEHCVTKKKKALTITKTSAENKDILQQLTLDGKELQRERKEVVCVVLLPLPTAAAASQLLSSARRRRLGK